MKHTAGPVADAFAALAAEPARGLICLDYDGTLAPIAPDPASAHPHPGAREVLARLAETFGTVALVTGRPALDAAAMLDLEAADAPVVRILGLYGREDWTRTDGMYAQPVPPGIPAARPEVHALAEKHGMRVEDKGLALAVHARGLPDPVEALRRVAGPLAEIANRHDLIVRDGRLVRELLAPGPDKGQALLGLARAVRAGACLYAGDDAADRVAFGVVHAMREHGVPGLAVAVVNREDRAVADDADVVVADPAALLAFLSRLTRDSG
jgi:trehalose 6-phosphate phosphatase